MNQPGCRNSRDDAHREQDNCHDCFGRTKGSCHYDSGRAIRSADDADSGAAGSIALTLRAGLLMCGALNACAVRQLGSLVPRLLSAST